MSNTRYIIAGNLIDGCNTTIRRRVFLGVKDTIISEIGSATDLSAEIKASALDFSHCTILPPLIDCSIFLSRSPAVDPKFDLQGGVKSGANKLALFKKHLSYCHAHGIFGVAECDDISDLLASVQRDTDPNELIDIRVMASPTPKAADNENPVAIGRDFHRISYSPDIAMEETSSPGISREELHHLLIKKGNRKVVVVANGPQAVRDALDAGCDGIEQGYYMGADNLQRIAAKGLLWIPSVLRAKNGLDSSASGGDVCCRFSQRYVAPGKVAPGAEAFWKDAVSNQLAQLRLAGELGVTVAVGTGAGSVGILHGESVVEEMKLFIKAGFSLEQTIRCASKNGADFFEMKTLGTLEIGRNATFLITRGSVKQLPRKLAFLEGIFVNGSPSTSYRKTPHESSR